MAVKSKISIKTKIALSLLKTTQILITKSYVTLSMLKIVNVSSYRLGKKYSVKC